MEEQEKKRTWSWWFWVVIFLFPIPIGIAPWWVVLIFVALFVAFVLGMAYALKHGSS